MICWQPLIKELGPSKSVLIRSVVSCISITNTNCFVPAIGEGDQYFDLVPERICTEFRAFSYVIHTGTTTSARRWKGTKNLQLTATTEQPEEYMIFHISDEELELWVSCLKLSIHEEDKYPSSFHLNHPSWMDHRMLHWLPGFEEWSVTSPSHILLPVCLLSFFNHHAFWSMSSAMQWWATAANSPPSHFQINVLTFVRIRTNRDWLLQCHLSIKIPLMNMYTNSNRWLTTSIFCFCSAPLRYYLINAIASDQLSQRIYQ